MAIYSTAPLSPNGPRAILYPSQERFSKGIRDSKSFPKKAKSLAHSPLKAGKGAL